MKNQGTHFVFTEAKQGVLKGYKTSTDGPFAAILRFEWRPSDGRQLLQTVMQYDDPKYLRKLHLHDGFLCMAGDKVCKVDTTDMYPPLMEKS